MHWTIFDELNNENDKAVNKTLKIGCSLLEYCTTLNINITSAKVPFYFKMHLSRFDLPSELFPTYQGENKNQNKSLL